MQKRVWNLLFNNTNLNLIKNLTVNNFHKKSIKKDKIHYLVGKLKKDLNFEISSLNINFIDSKNILEINKIYLKHNFTTDIITFNYTGDNNNLDGEIFISIDDAETNARKYKATFNQEIKRLIIHGILHLLGLEDNTKSQKLKMRSLENKYLNKFGF